MRKLAPHDSRHPRARGAAPVRRGLRTSWLLVPALAGIVALLTVAGPGSGLPHAAGGEEPTAAPEPTPEQAGRAPLTLLHTINNVGYIEPCG